MIFQPVINLTSSSGEWERPSDWLTVTKPTSQNSFKILNAIHEYSDNWAMFKMSGAVVVNSTYVVDWGDGTTDTYNLSGNFTIAATHQYDYTTISNTTLCSRGYKQVLITGTTLATITNLNFGAQEKLITTNQSHVYSGFLESYFSQGWKGVGFVTTASGASGYQYHEMLEYVYRDCVGVQFLENMCFWLRRLKKVDLINTESVISIYYTFGRCYDLRKVTMNLPVCVSSSYAFVSSTSIEETNLLNLPKLTGSIQMYLGTQIRKINLNLADYNDVFTNSRAEDITLDVSQCTAASLNLSTVPTLRSFHLIGATTTITTLNFTQTAMSRPAILQLFNDLPNRTSLTAGTITITGARGAHLITADDILVATNKNWTVIT